MQNIVVLFIRIDFNLLLGVHLLNYVAILRIKINRKFYFKIILIKFLKKSKFISFLKVSLKTA